MRNAMHKDEATIQPADPAARARALWLIAAFILVVGLLVAASVWLQGRLDPWAEDVAVGLVARPETLFIALFVIMLPLIGVSVYIFLQGRRIVQAERLPYPGQKVIRDTPVVRGAPAVRRGRIIQAIAVVMGLLSLAIPFIPPLFMLYLSKGT